MKKERGCFEMKALNEMKAVNLKAMSVDDLMVLRDRIHETLESRVKAERRELESRLARLKSLAAASEKAALKPRRTSLKGRKIAPKYRNPNKPSETWAGRGRLPLWMAAAMKAGKKMSDFRIAEAAAARARGQRKRR
jgi:DNA-binding protein H-NS